MDGSGREAVGHAFSAHPTNMHTEDQTQSVVSPASTPSLAHYQAQYAASYEAYHRPDMEVPTQHDPRQVQFRTLNFRGDHWNLADR